MNITTAGTFNSVEFVCNGRKMYTCKKRLESGAGGTVYRGLDSNQQVCALKVLKILKLNPVSSRALKCATKVDYDDCPHRSKVVWLRLQDGQLAATTSRGSQRVMLDLKTCVELFGVNPEETKSRRIPDNYKSWLKSRAVKLDEARLQNKFEHDTQGNVAKTAFLAEMLPKLPHK